MRAKTGNKSPDKFLTRAKGFGRKLAYNISYLKNKESLIKNVLGIIR